VRTTDLFGELETIVDRYFSELEPANADLGVGSGIAAFSGSASSQTEDPESEP